MLERQKRSRRYKEKDAAIRSSTLRGARTHRYAEHDGKTTCRMGSLRSKQPRQFFDPEWMFSLPPEEFTGFDVVIGNPPYVRQEKIKEEKAALKEIYDCFTGTADLYVYFYERGIQLLRDGGVFSFITSNKWMSSAYGQKLRAFLKANVRVRRLIDFGDAEIFDAIAYPCIVVFQKDKAGEDSAFRALNWNQGRMESRRCNSTPCGRHVPGVQDDLAPEAWRVGVEGQDPTIGSHKARWSPAWGVCEGTAFIAVS